MGKGLTPVAAYLAQDDIIRIALEHGVDMIHPGYAVFPRISDFEFSLAVVDMVSFLKMQGLRARWNKLDLRSLGPRRRSSILSEIRPRLETSVRTNRRSLGFFFFFIIRFAAIKVGVPVVPGTPGPVAAYTEAESFIKEYGFPGLSLPVGCAFSTC